MIDRVGTVITRGGDFSVTLAKPGDLETVRLMLVEAANWMQTGGVKQWNPEQFTPDLIRSYYDEREIYLLTREGEPAAMFTLQDSDPDYWGALNIPGYSYLHRLTVRLPYRGQGLGGEILSFAAKRSKVLGRSGLRLDCWNQNVKLNRLYQELGFRLQGTGRKDDGREFNLYQLAPAIYDQA
ncbi:GNAT family N-acetyltransferase [Paenibacillus macerans]|uniref:Acetyltransferase domain protein n=1 Tax=Paenibacillus macerans TaxID=44252 RepID=A0A090ZET7_PAEMA|nr:GNAT family N-acetyltransferase [Paenibacillus macerans]KFN08740.1 acetyltransferase domain protein [Paenibacillus macerans]MBS5912210.1 GNAT family N-acetyltransferase [Paenibacillus macerans]MCY7562120.1 GNAT family N-acetyltransferase [Paenibacillus macerans]MEC0140107.1 GNAT family N-acetyltransferase [Paenibacillus macerans]MEC0155129.1 GNAT family N-acetyltransferase [Paenibacillus macerans]